MRQWISKRAHASTVSRTRTLPEGLVGHMSRSRTERTRALEAWADRVESGDLNEADTEALRAIARLAEQRDAVEEELTQAVRAARIAERSWSEIGAMLGVSKQAAQRKYASQVIA